MAAPDDLYCEADARGNCVSLQDSQDEMDTELEPMLSYSSISKLTARDLKEKCLKHGIDLTHSKTAKVALLCHKLGISTCGQTSSKFTPREQQSGLNSQQKIEFEALNPGYVATLQGWEKGLSDCPDLDDATVKRYLLDADLLDAVSSRKYKISRPFQLKTMVHSLNFHQLPSSESFCLIRSFCNPSQSTSDAEVKSLYCVLDKWSGTPYGGYCTCTAGYCQACGHIGAMLFVLADIIASGDSSIPPDASVTDVPAYWAKPKGAAVSPKLLSSIQVTKEVKDFRRTETDYGSRYMASRPPPSAQIMQKLRARVKVASHTIGKEIPLCHALHPRRFHAEQQVACVTSLPQAASELDQSIAIAAACEVRTSATLPIADLPYLKDITDEILQSLEGRQRIVDKLVFSPSECNLIEDRTRGQNNNLEWYNQHRGSITASGSDEIYRVCIGKSKANTSRLSNKCLAIRWAKLKRLPRCNKSSLKWGHANEEKGRKEYIGEYSSQHTNLKVSLSGLVTLPEAPYLRCSPDGIVICKCHSPRLLEVKCPFAARKVTVEEGMRLKKIQYISKVDGKFVLSKTNTMGYYTQVQMSLGILGLKTCDFVVWTRQGIEMAEVPFDELYWNSLLCNLKTFFRDFVLLEIPNLPQVTSDSVPDVDRNSDDECLAALKSFEAQVVPDNNFPTPTPSPLQPVPEIRKNVAETENEVDDSENNPLSTSATVVHCRNHRCRKILPEEDLIAEDNSNASVQCECHCGCSVWYCWPCAGVSEENESDDWFCGTCSKKCLFGF